MPAARYRVLVGNTHDELLLNKLEGIYSRGETTATDRVALVVAAALEEVGADAGFVATVAGDGSTIEVARVTRHSEHPVRLAFPLNSPYPLAEVMRRGSTLFIASNEQLRCDHPGLVRVAADDHACATLPLRDAAGELIGALNLAFEDPHEFSADEKKAIEALAERCGHMLEDDAGA